MAEETPLIVQILLFDLVVLRVFRQLKFCDISIQALTGNWATKSLLWKTFNAVPTIWRTRWPLLTRWKLNFCIFLKPECVQAPREHTGNFQTMISSCILHILQGCISCTHQAWQGNRWCLWASSLRSSCSFQNQKLWMTTKSWCGFLHFSDLY